MGPELPRSQLSGTAAVSTCEAAALGRLGGAAFVLGPARKHIPAQIAFPCTPIGSGLGGQEASFVPASKKHAYHTDSRRRFSTLQTYMW